MNLLVAIIADHYGQVKAKAGNKGETILGQAKVLWADWVWWSRYQGRQLQRKTIYLLKKISPQVKLKPYPDEPIRREVPFDDLLEALVAAAEEANSKGASLKGAKTNE